jgi:hypothetical protein
VPEEVRLWKIKDGSELVHVPSRTLDLEERLEEWVARDPSILDPELLIVGRQVETEHGGYIDLLCLNRAADVVIVELKKGQTPREVTAQALDYASWVGDLSSADLIEIANRYLGANGPLETAFRRRFGSELPDAVNENHGILIVASSIDSSTKRIIRYLSDTHGVSINAATFHYFRSDEGYEWLARLFLVEPETVATQARLKSASKRRPNLTLEQLSDIAVQNGVGTLYEQIVADLTSVFSGHTTISSLAFTGDFQGSRRTIMGLFPTRSDAAGGLHFQVYSQRMTQLLGASEADLVAALPANHSPWSYYPGADADLSGYNGTFRSKDEVNKFLSFVHGKLSA